jgi:uncharacterized protein (DUF302 family)
MEGQSPAKDRYGYSRVVPFGFDQAVDRTKAALKDQGFGVLAEIDIQKAMREKLGVEIPRYLILGACNPPLAHQALQADPDIGLLLPCNVVVREREGRVEVAVVDAQKMMSVVGDDRLKDVADQATDRLRRALAAI